MVKVVEQVMNKRQVRWEEFCEALEGVAGCDFTEKVPGEPSSVTWKCGEPGDEFFYARKIMTAMGLSEEAIEASLGYPQTEGGYCDCEILFNVA